MKHDEGNGQTATSHERLGQNEEQTPENVASMETPATPADVTSASPTPTSPGEEPAEAVSGRTEKAPSDEGSEGGEAQPTATPTHRPTFTPGDPLGPYTITHGLPASPETAPFVAVLSEGEDTGVPGLPGLHYLLLPLEAADAERAHAVIVFGLQHTRLLVPRAVVPVQEGPYLVVEIVADLDGSAPQSVLAGARLSVADTLRAGGGLADALAYLHRNGLAHLHIGPETLYVRDGRAYLGGLERAASLSADRDAAAEELRADANALARVLADLVDRAELTAETSDTNVTRLEGIIAKGQANGYTAPDEVAADCGQALTSTREHAQGAPEVAQAQGQEAPQERFSLRFASATTVGMVRAENQDAVATLLFEVHDDLIGDMPAGVFLVADGMGGEAHGEVASRIAARIVTSEMARTFFAPLVAIPATVAVEEGTEPLRSDEDLAAALVRAVIAANTQVRALADYLNQPTGTTLTALAMRGTQAVVAHLGDSRAYLMHEGELRLLTEDHSLLARMEALDHPLLRDDSLFISRSILYRSLGQEDAAPPDVLDVPLHAGDRLMLCSDGLWDELSDDVIGRVVGECPDPQTCANELVRLANEAGGNDNSTALVIFVDPEPVDTAIIARSMAPTESPDETPTEGEGEEDE